MKNWFLLPQITKKLFIRLKKFLCADFLGQFFWYLRVSNWASNWDQRSWRKNLAWTKAKILSWNFLKIESILRAPDKLSHAWSQVSSVRACRMILFASRQLIRKRSQSTLAASQNAHCWGCRLDAGCWLESNIRMFGLEFADSTHSIQRHCSTVFNTPLSLRNEPNASNTLENLARFYPLEENPASVSANLNRSNLPAS